MSQYGQVVAVKILKKNGHSRGFGFVTFKAAVVAEYVITLNHVIEGQEVSLKALESSAGTLLIPQFECKLLKSEKEAKNDAQDQKQRKIFIGGLHRSVTADQLRAYFEKYGKISNAVINKEHYTNVSRGCGFVLFENKEAAAKALESNDHSLDGRKIDVQECLLREEIEENPEQKKKLKHMSTKSSAPYNSLPNMASGSLQESERIRDDVASIKSLKQESDWLPENNCKDPVYKSASNIPNQIKVCHTSSGQYAGHPSGSFSGLPRALSKPNPLSYPQPRPPQIDNLFLPNQFRNPYLQSGIVGDSRMNFNPVDYPPRHDTPMPLDFLDAPFSVHGPHVYSQDPHHVKKNPTHHFQNMNLFSLGLTRKEAHRNPQMNLVFNGGCKRAYQITDLLKKKLGISAQANLDQERHIQSIDVIKLLRGSVSGSEI